MSNTNSKTASRKAGTAAEILGNCADKFVEDFGRAPLPGESCAEYVEYMKSVIGQPQLIHPERERPAVEVFGSNFTKYGRAPQPGETVAEYAEYLKSVIGSENSQEKPDKQSKLFVERPETLKPEYTELDVECIVSNLLREILAKLELRIPDTDEFFGLAEWFCDYHNRNPKTWLTYEVTRENA